MDARVERNIDVPGALTDFAEARDRSEIVARFRSLIAQFGFDAFACGEVDVRDFRRSVFYVVDWPAGFADAYHSGNRLLDCPLVRALAKYDRPYRWTDVKDICIATKGSAALFNAARAQGWTDGLVVPVARGGARKGVIHMMGPRIQITEFETETLALLAAAFLDRVRTMLAGSDELICVGGLSPRQIDCMRLVASGQTDKAIAIKLGIGPSTVHEYVHNARARLGAKTRAEAVAVMVSLGMATV